MAILGALASRAKLLKRVGEESIYATEGDMSGAGGIKLASDEL